MDPIWTDRAKSLLAAGLDVDRRGLIGSAQIMVHHPGDDSSDPVFEGQFSVNRQTFQIMTRDKYLRVKTPLDVEVEEIGDLVVVHEGDRGHSDPSHKAHSCSHESLPFNSRPDHPILSGVSLFDPFSTLSSRLPLNRRDDTGGMTSSTNYIDSIGSSNGCPTTQQIIYMGVALDCNYVTTYGSTDAARTQALNDWNQVSALYKATFNISLGIIELQVQNATCPTSAVSGQEWNVGCDTNRTLDERLSDFSNWRGQKGDDGAGLWHLLSACPTDSEVGVAWLGTLCQTSATDQDGSWVSGTGISTATTTEWSLIAHEIGHG